MIGLGKAGAKRVPATARGFGQAPHPAAASSRTATRNDGDLAGKSQICPSVADNIGEVSVIAQSDYLNALLAFLV